MLRFAKHPAQLCYRGKVLLSTFAGQESLFGQGDLDSAWGFIKDILKDAGVEV